MSYRKLVLRATFAALALAALSATPGARGQTAVTNGHITFTRPSFTGPGDVFIANPDGSNVVQVPLVYPAEDFSVPVWSAERQPPSD